jgi:hypothetical protein
VCADDEPFYSLSFPFSCFGAGVNEILNFLDAVIGKVGSLYETPFFSKGVYEVGRKRYKVLGAYVETV